MGSVFSIDGRENLLHVFTAHPDENTEPIRYFQFVTLNGQVAYGFTGVMYSGEDESLLKSLLDIFTNVQFT